MAKIYYIDVRIFNKEEIFEKHLGNLSEERQSKVLRYRFDKDKKLSLGAGVLLDFGLRQFGLRERDVVFDQNAYGKPIIPNGINFNLSHSGLFALAAISDTPIGADIEVIERHCLDPVQYLAPGEQRYIYSHDLAKQKEAFIRLWCLKESFSKATGLGLSLPLDAYEITIDGENITVAQDHDSNNYYFYEFTLPGHRAAICGIDSKFQSPIEICLTSKDFD